MSARACVYGANVWRSISVWEDEFIFLSIYFLRQYFHMKVLQIRLNNRPEIQFFSVNFRTLCGLYTRNFQYHMENIDILISLPISVGDSFKNKIP